MKHTKVSPDKTVKIDLGTKEIYKYPLPTKLLDISVMKVKGRHPKDPKTFVVEHDCQFVMYVTKGKGRYYLGDDVVSVEEGDVVYVPTETKFAVEGEFEYVTVDIPAFYLEQSEEVGGK